MNILLILIVLGIPFILSGVVLGWVAAGRIRRSGGQLYGLHLAVFSALAVPAVMAFILPLAVGLLIMRLGAMNPQFDVGDSVYLCIGFTVTLWVVGFKLVSGSYRHLRGTGGILDGFRLKNMRAALIGLCLLWLGIGTVLFLQRSRPIEEGLISTSPDGRFTAKVTAFKHMNLLGPDKVSFLHQIMDGNEVIFGAFEAAKIPEFKSASRFEDPYFHFSKHGAINWTSIPGQVVFLLHGKVTYQTALPQLHAEKPEADH